MQEVVGSTPASPTSIFYQMREFTPAPAKTVKSPPLSPVKIAFASGTDELNRSLIAHMRALLPELPLLVVSEFPPDDKNLKWVPWHVNRSFLENFARCRSALRGHSIRLAGVMLVPNVPFRRMRVMALLLSPSGFIAFNENLNHFMLRPGSFPTIFRHLVWRTKNLFRASVHAVATADWKQIVALYRSRPADALPTDLATSDVAFFPGREASGKPRVLVASCYTIFPLSHGGAVRMYNLMRRAAQDFDQILVVFTDEIQTPPPEVLAICTEVVLVRRRGSHALPSRGRPDVVEEFSSPVFLAALKQMVQKWQPAIAQLEFTQMAQYAAACAPARTILVEHDITLDLYSQMLQLQSGHDDWELRRQLKLWERFERDAWRRVNRVVTMSEKDRQLAGDTAITLPNGVDLDRFRPSSFEPEPRRILFIGSFAHLPNLIALEFFLKQVWPLLSDATLHIIAGNRHEYYLDFYRDRVQINLAHPGIETEGFVSDVRPAYERAAVVIAPLLASAGTNIKILEAMAMGKAIVSTPAGINGLDLSPGTDMILATTAAEMAAAIEELFNNPAVRRRIETAARQTAEREFNWDAIAQRQRMLYRETGG